MKNEVDKLLGRHQKLVQSDFRKVTSHMQRSQGDWIINTLSIEGSEVPFRYKRKRLYKEITGQHVNLTYYRDTESVAGIEMEIMKVVRLKIT